MIRGLYDFWVSPKFRNYDLTNIVFYSIDLCLAALFGSVVSVVVISTAVYSSLHLLTGRLRWSLPDPVRLVYFALCGFFAAEAVAAIANPTRVSLGEVAENIPFLGFAGVYAITFIDRRKLLRMIESVAAAASPFLLILALLGFGHHDRAELMTGNPSVLALTSGILFVINIGAAFRAWSLVSLVHLAAAACVVTLAVMTGTRGIWPALIVMPIIGLACFGSRRAILWGAPVVILALNSVMILALTSSDVVETRLGALKADVEAIMTGDLSGSIGRRVQIYQAGYELFLEKPLLGHGPGNERNEIARITSSDGGVPLSYSHAHNAALNAVLRAGVLGFIALALALLVPFTVAAQAQKDDVGWAGFFVLSGFLAVYLSSGATGLLLGHDMHDTIYIAGLCYSLYLVFGRTQAAAGDPRR